MFSTKQQLLRGQNPTSEKLRHGLLRSRAAASHKVKTALLRSRAAASQKSRARLLRRPGPRLLRRPRPASKIHNWPRQRDWRVVAKGGSPVRKACEVPAVLGGACFIDYSYVQLRACAPSCGSLPQTTFGTALWWPLTKLGSALPRDIFLFEKRIVGGAPCGAPALRRGGQGRLQEAPEGRSST